MGLFDLIGVLGAVAILAAYALLMFGKLQRTQAWFLWLNAVGSAGIIASLSVDFNAGALLIEAAWLAISLFGLARLVLKRGAVS